MFGEFSLFGGPKRSSSHNPAAVVRCVLGQDIRLEERTLCAAGVTASLTAFGAQAWNAPTSYRGFMVNPATFADPATRDAALNELKAWNVNVVRWEMLPVAGRPL